MEDVKCETDTTARPRTKFCSTRERNKHNILERERRMNIKKQVKKLEECLPNVTREKGRGHSEISIVRKAISCIEETREANAKLRGENLSLAQTNTALERQISEVFERQQASKIITETEEIVDSILETCDSEESSSLFSEAINFEEDVTEFMMKHVMNSQSEFWSLSQEFE